MHIKNFDPYDFSKKDIEGVGIYHKNIPWAPCIHIRMLFSAGAFNDPKNKAGVAHFLEHMIFDGSEQLPHKKDIEEFGKNYTMGTLNAYTSPFSTNYIAKCLPENFEKVLNGMSDMIFKPILRVEDVEHERSVITQEAWGRYKNEKFLKYTKNYLNNVYNGHSFSRIGRALGWPETIQNISQKDVKEFHSKTYCRENLTVVLVGAVEKKHIEIIKRVIEKIPKGLKVKIIKNTTHKPINNRLEITGEEIGDPTEQVSLSIERLGNSLTDKEKATAQHANQLLRDLLHERLRIEHSLCYGVRTSIDNQIDYYSFGIEVRTSVDKKDVAEKEIWKIISEIKDGKHESRFNTIHKIRIDWFKSEERFSDDIAEYACNVIRKKGKVVTLKSFLNDEKNVTYKDVINLIKKVFDTKYIYTEIILPSK